MSFLLNCPTCGERTVHEFRFGGAVTPRPAPDAGDEAWTRYFYFRPNTAGVQQEWWNHRYGCRKWFLVDRDTTTNRIEQTHKV